MIMTKIKPGVLACGWCAGLWLVRLVSYNHFRPRVHVCVLVCVCCVVCVYVCVCGWVGVCVYVYTHETINN